MVLSTNAILRLEAMAHQAESFETSVWILDENGKRIKLVIELDNWKVAAYPLEEGTRFPTLHLDMPNDERPFLKRYYSGPRHGAVDSWRGPGPKRGYTFSEAMIELARGLPNAKPELDSIAIKSKKSSHKTAELKCAAITSWCEAFGVTVPTSAELKRAKTTSKNKANEQRARVEQMLRSGSVGIEEWNKKSLAQRKKENLRELNLSGSALGKVVLKELDLSGSDFTGADLSEANLQLGTYKDAKFDNVFMKQGNMRHCTANGVSFCNGRIVNSDFYGTNFREADFSGTRFEGCNLSNCNLRGSKLANALFKDCQFDSAEFDSETSLPLSFDYLNNLKWSATGIDPRKAQALNVSDTTQSIDFKKLIWRLEKIVDKKRLTKSLKMLKNDQFKLFAEVTENSVTGVVKSQTDPDLVYSCRLSSDGDFFCCTQNLFACGGLRGALCKHILLLLLGLAHAEELDPQLADKWARASTACTPLLDKQIMTDTFLRHKGAEAGEVDWRPIETIPEDFYSF